MERREPNDSYRHVLKYTGVFGGVQGLKICVTLIRNKLTARLLGEAGMGLNKRFINISDVLYAWTNFGLSFYSVQRISEIYEEGTEEQMNHFIRVIRTWGLWSALLGALLCFFLASTLNDYYIPDEPHRLEIMLLSLFVASLSVEAVECALLKGLRRLRTVALIEVLSALSTFLFTIPLYFLLGMRGIALSLVLCGWATAFLHLYFSTRIYPYRVHLLSFRIVCEGWPLIRMGIPYVLAGVVTAMATGEVFKFLGDDRIIGLYSVGYGLMVTYAGMIFKAMDADFFPRLSSINHDTQRLNHAINQQIDVCVSLMAPFLIIFILFMPWVVSLLYSGQFLPVVPMAVCAVFYMFFKAVTTPMAYTALAKGDSLTFLFVETIYNVVFVWLMILGYSKIGLTGTGLALSASALFDLLLIGIYYGIRYRVRLRLRTLTLIFPQAALLTTSVLACLFGTPLLRYVVCLFCLLLSIWFSWKRITPELPVWEKLRHKIGGKKGANDLSDGYDKSER